MTKREKVIRGLEICTNPGSCSERCPYYHIEITEGSCDYFLLTDALSLLKEQEARATWHKWPDEKPEDYVDSTFPEGKGCWEITCLSLSRNGRVYLQKRTRFINWDPGNCHWSHWPDHGSAGWWMFIPKLPKEGEADET